MNPTLPTFCDAANGRFRCVAKNLARARLGLEQYYAFRALYLFFFALFPQRDMLHQRRFPGRE